MWRAHGLDWPKVEMMTEFAAPLPILARYAVMVDVGYIYAAAGELLFGTSSRREYRVDAVSLIEVIKKHADELIRGELLRVYWYDAARDRVPTIDQRVIAQMPWVKLRLGNLNARGQQKGVDAQIRADMEALARHRAITDAVLIAGDEDMVPAVEAAQAYGVRVHLWGIEPPYGTNQAERLVWESDTVDVLDGAFLRAYFTKNPVSVETVRPDGTTVGPPGAGVSATAPTPAQLFGGDRHARPPVMRSGHTGGFPAATGPMPRLGPDRVRVEEAGEHVAQKWILTRGRDNIRDLLPGPILPPVIDKELLVDAEKELGLSLRPYQEAREWLRDAFWERVHREFGIIIGKSRSLCQNVRWNHPLSPCCACCAATRPPTRWPRWSRRSSRPRSKRTPPRSSSRPRPGPTPPAGYAARSTPARAPGVAPSPDRPALVMTR